MSRSKSNNSAISCCHLITMSKLFIILAIVLGSSLSCLATMYNVGDTSGWDISTDLDSWPQNKRFVVGDVLSFQYASRYNVNKVTKESYDTCNTTNVIQSSSTGNSTFTLTDPGDEYFICGNKLYCMSGMKLHVYVDENQAASLASAPLPTAGGVLPPNGSKSDNPTSVSSSVGLFSGIIGTHALAMMFISFSLLFHLV